MPAASAATTYYVDNDKAECPSAGFTTIQAAIDNSASGDTVFVCPGIYDEYITIDKQIVLKGEDAIIKPTALSPAAVEGTAVYINAVDGVTVEGFEIDGTAAPVNNGIYAFNSNDVTVTKNVIHDMQNNVYDVAGLGILYFGWGQGINGGIIDRNTVYNTPRMGIFIGGMDSGDYHWLTSSNDLISRNLVYNTWQGPTSDGGGAIQMNGAKASTITGNTVHHTTLGGFYTGIYLFGAETDNVISKNNVHHNQYGIAWYYSLDPTLSKNNFHNNVVNIKDFGP